MDKLFGGKYKGKRVLVTGHTGFKGSWLSLWLSKLGADVIGYSLKPNTSPSLFEILDLEKDITSVIGDIRDDKMLFDTFKKYQPEIVFHLAAQPIVRESYENPKETYETNVIGTLNVFEAIRKSSSVKVVVNITTDKCYENKEWVYGYRETDPMGGYDPYSSSKACSEILTSSYRSSFFNDLDIAVSSVRAGNVIGGGDWAKDRLIPDIVRSLADGKDIITRNPSAVRPWQHVLEPLSGYLWLGSLMISSDKEYNESWNFGPVDSDVLSVLEILKNSIKAWGSGNFKIDKNKNPHEANLLKLDISKVRSILKWEPCYDVRTAVEETIKWYKNFYNNKDVDMKDFTINQIKKFSKVANEKNILWGKIDGE